MLLARLHEPVRGASIDQALALRADEAADKIPFTEAWRRLKGIPSLKRSWWAGLLIGASVVPIAIFLNFFFEKVYNVDSITARGAITTLYSLGSLVGLQIGSKYSTKALMDGDLPRLSTLGGVALLGSAGGLLILATAPWIGVSIAFVFVIGLGTSFNSFGLPLARGDRPAPPALPGARLLRVLHRARRAPAQPDRGHDRRGARLPVRHRHPVRPAGHRRARSTPA